jgi:hypothetical protein
MFIAREAAATTVTSEIVLSTIINEKSTGASVGLNAIAVQNARNSWQMDGGRH